METKSTSKKRPKKMADHKVSRVAAELGKLRLGRYPFLAGIKHYGSRKSIRYTPTTIENDSRHLRYFAGIFETLKTDGKISSTDPRFLDHNAIEQFYRWMKNKNLKNSTHATYVKVLKRYLKMWGNNVIEQMINDDEIILPSADGDGEINALTIDEVRCIFATVDDMSGYRGVIIRLLISLGVGTGCRPKELFNAQVSDISIKAETFFVRHPKGEGSWGKTEKVNIIRQDMLIRIDRELKARADYLEGIGVKSKYVFVNPKSGKPYTANTLRRFKALVAEASGVDFMIKDLRSTLLTLLVNEDLEKLGAASLQLRHSRIANTQKFYLKINKRSAVRKAFSDEGTKDPI
jgi:integrase/recombinase XerD